MQVVSNQEEFQWLLLVLIGYLLSLLPDSLLWIGCLSTVLVLGVPHGALDIYLLWSQSEKKIKVYLFSIARYISFSLLSLFVWKISPSLFWILFFFAAVYHFGNSDEHPSVLATFASHPVNRLLWILSRGTILVFAPATFHPEKIQSYLNQAAPESFASGFVQIAPFLFTYAICFYLVSSTLSLRQAKLRTHRFLLLKHFFSVGIFVLLFMVADPLVGFSLYFCCHHSLNHWFRVSQKKSELKVGFLILALFFTLPIIPLWVWARGEIAGGAVPEGMVSACFVAIAALTFPHLFVVEKLHQKLNQKFQRPASGRI